MALILAILSLMLLTFLGLTLAVTTSTELQIATNYRWSQQAQYNAEAGLEAGRVILAQVADMSSAWDAKLYTARPVAWVKGSAPAPDLAKVALRDYEKSDCDESGGVGYGVVLSSNAVAPAVPVRYENQSSFAGRTLNGAFTVWIRRPLDINAAGQYVDVPDRSQVVLVAEGVAPYTGTANAFTQARQAVRVLETNFTLQFSEAGEPCGLGRGMGQEGLSPMGENFNQCAPVTSGATGSLATVFGGTSAAGELKSKAAVE